MTTQTKLTSLFILVLTLLQTQNSIAQQDSIAMKYASTITVEDLTEDLTILSSDALEGRETGKRGQKMAAAYIKAHFEELGLTGPLKEGNSFYQKVPLVTSKPGEIYIRIGETKLLNGQEMFLYGAPNGVDEIVTEVVFAGAGSKSDFKGLDIKGKSVLVINTDQGARGKAMRSAYENGAEMVFMIRAETDKDFNKVLKRFSGFFNRETMKLQGGKEEVAVSAFYIKPSDASLIFGKSFDKLTKAITDKANGRKKALKKIKSGKASYKIEYNTKKIISENVLGFLEGSEFKDEVIVMTAHYDHEGIKNGVVYNGADDDGSGTVAIMDIAEAFVNAKKAGKGPRRSILFMTVTGEEKGLLGSEYYADNPVFPLENTVVNLNMDMIGRIGEEYEDKGEYIRLIGSDAMSTELHNINEAANEMYTNLHLDYTVNDKNHPSRSYYRSDHWNFAKNGIPIISYGNGPHADYHKPTDTVDKIEFELLRKRAQLIFYTAWEVANRNERIVIDKPAEVVGSK